MKHILTLVFATATFLGFAQPWNFVGSATGINNATEVDIEITANGQLYIAYIDSDNSNKITVRKWINQSWQLVGTAGLGDANAFDMQLIVNGENPVVAAKYLSGTYQFLECFAFNGTAWNAMGVGTYFSTEHSRDYAITANATGDLFATYYNTEYQTFDEGLITVKLGTGVQIGGGILDDNNGGFLQGLAAVSTTGNNLYVAFEDDMDMDYGISVANVSTSSHTGNTANYGTDAQKIVFERGQSSTNYSLMHMTQYYNAKTLYYKAYNGTSFGTELQVASSTTLNDFDFTSYGSNTFVYYRQGTTCYFKQITGDMSPSASITTITSGAGLSPGSATSLAAEAYYGNYVIAYIDGGKCYVKEYNSAADVDDWAYVLMCEGGTWDNNGQGAVYIYDSNYSQANITMTCTSQNTAIIPQSAINVYFDGYAYYYLTINNTNDVTTTTTIDLKWDLFENGNLIETIYMPATVYNTPTVDFNFPSVQACENASPISLVNKAVPAGGTWSGAGISGMSFNPGAFNPSPSTSTYLVYTKTSPQGCVAKDSILFTINETPNLAITSSGADCNEANGTASVTITGGTPSYTSYWSNGSTFTSISDLEPGQYYFNTTDANGCIAVGVASVASSGITLSESITEVTCNGASTGAIDLTVGGNGPFTYAWSNGATTQDVTGLPAGSYEVVITDDEDCISTASYTIQQPAPITLSSMTTTTPSCGSSNGSITVAFTGGAQPFDYQWENSVGAPIGTNSVTVNMVSSGYYVVEVTDDEGCMHSETVLLSDPNSPVIAIDTIMPSDCSNNGAVEIIDVNGGSTFQWSTGATAQNLTDVGPGTYVLEATGGNGCSSYIMADVLAAQPEPTEICLVTVDTSTNTNLIVWQKPLSSTIDHFNIYRETSQAGVYQLAGSVLYGDPAIYNDLVASPSVRSWRYKVSSVDGCGVESDISVHHKTIHLIINQGLGGVYNLIWDSYEGFSYSEFTIWRHTAIEDWIEITTMPTNLFTYSDTPPTEDDLEYLVTVNTPSTCSVEKSMQQDFNTTRSNKDKTSFGGTQSVNELLDIQTKVYPVPSSGQVYVSNSGNQSVQARLIDQTGRVITSFEVKTGVQQFDISYLATGVYNLELTQNEAVINKRVVIQK